MGLAQARPNNILTHFLDLRENEALPTLNHAYKHTCTVTLSEKVGLSAYAF